MSKSTQPGGIESPTTEGSVVSEAPVSLAELARDVAPKLSAWRDRLAEHIEEAEIEFMGEVLTVRYRPAILTVNFADSLAKMGDEVTKAYVYAQTCRLVVSFGTPEEGFEAATPEAFDSLPPTFLRSIIAGVSRHATGAEDLDPNESGGSFG